MLKSRQNKKTIKRFENMFKRLKNRKTIVVITLN